MGLALLDVPPRQGWRWILAAFAVWRRRPLSLVALFMAFMLAVLLLMALVPVLGGLLGLAAVPLLTLAYMLATRETLAGRRFTMGVLLAGLRGVDPARRRAQITLCLGYALGSVLVIKLSDWADGGALDTLMRELSSPEGKPSPELFNDGALLQGMLVRVLLALALSVPYWYAPALVHWGGQGAGQALFSSTLALWRARKAFVVYSLGWAALLLTVVPMVAIALSLLGLPKLVATLAMPMGLVFTAVFYTSLWFGYADSFGQPDGAPAGDRPAGPGT